MKIKKTLLKTIALVLVIMMSFSQVTCVFADTGEARSVWGGDEGFWDGLVRTIIMSY